MFDTKLKKCRRPKTGNAGNSIPIFDSHNSLLDIGLLFYVIFIFYCILGMVSILFLLNPIDTEHKLGKANNFVCPFDPALSNLPALIKLWYSILVVFLIKQIFLHKEELIFQKYLKISWKCVLGRTLLCKKGKRFNRIIAGLFCWLCLINFFLIVIVNPSMLNPGPDSKNLSVAYQNVTGLIPFKELGKPHPKLDETKILELNSYLSNFRPGIIILNETWLTGSIKDPEVIPREQYKLYREDRTKQTHPPDTNDPKNLGLMVVGF